MMLTQTAIVLGNYVYIDGGEVSQSVAGQLPPDDHPSYGINSTLSIDISKSWWACTVEIRTIPRKGPVPMNTEAIWSDSTGNGFYVYGGVASYGANTTSISKNVNGIWKFTADGQGGGSWSLEKFASSADTLTSRSLPVDMLRFTADMAYASTAGLGFSIGGGYQGGDDSDSGGDTPSTSNWDMGRPNWQTSTSTSGMVSYDMEKKQLANYTSIGMLASNQSLEGGKAIHVSGFGPNDGLIFVLGGSAKNADANPRSGGSWRGNLVGFANVSFFDPASKQWYWQMTTGEAPTGRVGHCIVGAKSPEGSFEM